MVISKEDIMTALKTIGLIASLVASFKGGDFLKGKESNEQMKNIGTVIQEIIDRNKCKEGG